MSSWALGLICPGTREPSSGEVAPSPTAFLTLLCALSVLPLLCLSSQALGVARLRKKRPKATTCGRRKGTAQHDQSGTQQRTGRAWAKTNMTNWQINMARSGTQCLVWKIVALTVTFWRRCHARLLARSLGRCRATPTVAIGPWEVLLGHWTSRLPSAWSSTFTASVAVGPWPSSSMEKAWKPCLPTSWGGWV